MTRFRTKNIPRWPLLAVSILAVAALILGFAPLTGNTIKLSYQPSEGWTVCADLGVGPVPGLNITRQRFRLCSDTGWEILAYCLEPERPMPPIGRMCSEFDPGVFWCGDDVQQVQFYQVAQRPTPGSTRTPTSTLTRTPTLTTTPLATLTLVGTATLQSTRPSPNQVETEVYSPGGGREQAGGETNLIWFALLASSSAGLIWLQGSGLRRLLKKRK